MENDYVRPLEFIVPLELSYGETQMFPDEDHHKGHMMQKLNQIKAIACCLITSDDVSEDVMAEVTSVAETVLSPNYINQVSRRMLHLPICTTRGRLRWPKRWRPAPGRRTPGSARHTPTQIQAA